MLTEGQRNILHYMAGARWWYLGVTALFVALLVVQIIISPGGLSSYLTMFVYVVTALTHLTMYVIVRQWRLIFSEYM